MCIQNAIPVFHQDSCFRVVRETVRSVDFMCKDSLSHIFGYEKSSLVRSNTMWNTVVLDKAFCKSTDGSLGEALCAGNANL